MVGDLPWSVVCRSYNNWAVGKKYSRRSSRALHRRVNVAGYSIKATGIWIDVVTIAMLLGMDSETIRRWMRAGLIDYYLEGRKYYVKRDNLRAFARNHPELFRNRKRDDLFLLLDCEELADQLSRSPMPLRPGREEPVLCIETGRVYRSYFAAAKSHHVSRQAISNAVRFGHLSAGFHWQRTPKPRKARNHPRNRVASASC